MAEGPIIEVNDNDFEEVIKDGVTLVDYFEASSFRPSKFMPFIGSGVSK